MSDRFRITNALLHVAVVTGCDAGARAREVVAQPCPRVDAAAAEASEFTVACVYEAPWYDSIIPLTTIVLSKDEDRCTRTWWKVVEVDAPAEDADTIVLMQPLTFDKLPLTRTFHLDASSPVWVNHDFPQPASARRTPVVGVISYSREDWTVRFDMTIGRRTLRGTARLLHFEVGSWALGY
jgi:hypothetical protein